MWKYLDELRQKNDAQKLIITICASALFTFIIAATWMAAMTDNDDKKKGNIVNKKDEVRPISNLSEQVGELKGMFSGLVSEWRTAKEILVDPTEIMEAPEEIELDIQNATNSTTSIKIESNVE